MRVLVCGGRDYTDRGRVFRELDALHKANEIRCVIEGGASGVDLLAASWARVHEVSSWRFPAEWLRWGKAAGRVRNGRMLMEGKPDLVLAFAGGDGTNNVINQARNAGVLVQEVGDTSLAPKAPLPAPSVIDPE